jgi:hypothetical protein
MHDWLYESCVYSTNDIHSAQPPNALHDFPVGGGLGLVSPTEEL